MTAGSRNTNEGTDYLFKAQQSFGADDTGSEFTIYITVPTGQKPVFTRVDR